MTTNIYDFSLDTSFGTIIMYFYSFDEDIKHKKMDILEKLIETHNGVYKLIFEIIFQNNKYKIDYDNTGFDELIKNPECIVSKLYVLKRSLFFIIKHTGLVLSAADDELFKDF